MTKLKLNKYLFLALSASVLTACSPRYVAPDIGPTATVRLGGQIPFALIYEGGTKCDQHRRWPAGYFDVLEGQDAIDPATTLLKIKANQPFGFGAFRARVASSGYLRSEVCSSMMSFVPKPNRNYVVYYNMTNNQGKECQISLLETTTETSTDYIKAEDADFKVRGDNRCD